MGPRHPDVQQWITLSDYDVKTAEAMLRSKRYLYVLFCCQQAIEKRLKGYVTLATKLMPPKTHDLLRLAGLARIPLEEERELFLRRLNNYYIGTRYPEEVNALARELTSTLAKKYLNDTKECLTWLDALMK